MFCFYETERLSINNITSSNWIKQNYVFFMRYIKKYNYNVLHILLN